MSEPRSSPASESAVRGDGKTDCCPRTPDVSVVIAAYRPRWLRDAIASALSQTHLNLEVVVCADGDSKDLAAAAASFNDERLRFLPSKGQLGACRTHSRAIAAARSGVVGILNDDDLWEPELVATLLPALDDPEIVVSFGNHWIMDGYGTVDEAATNEYERVFGRALLSPGRYRPFHRMALIDLSIPVCCCALFRREPVNKHLRPAWGTYYDRGIAYRLARTNGCAAFSDARLARYRVYATQTIQTRHEENCLSFFAVTRDILRDARTQDWDAAVRRDIRRQHAESEYRLGTVRLRLKGRRSALPSLVHAARLGYPKAFTALVATLLPLRLVRRLRRLASAPSE
jgi:glycosyltransferase involved in cell wall biosynthesis